jgi:hypothetical protein
MTLGVLDLAVISFVSLILVSNTSAGMIDKEGMDEWEVCAMCHSLDGVSRMPKFPKLAGQKSSYISNNLIDVVFMVLIVKFVGRTHEFQKSISWVSVSIAAGQWHSSC